MSLFIVADFDETLIDQNSLFPVYRRLSRKPLLYHLLPSLLRGHWMKRGLRAAMKREIYQTMLRGLPAAELEAIGYQIAPKLSFKQAVLDRIRQYGGQDLVIASAALTPVVEGVLQAKPLPYARVIATQAEIRNGVCTGRLLGGECFGPIKAQRVQQVRHRYYPEARMIAFGNWPDDRAMLRHADEAYIVSGHRIRLYREEESAWRKASFSSGLPTVTRKHPSNRG